MYTILIPAYQPDEKLITLLQQIKERLTCRVVVIDDGSTGEAINIIDMAKQYAHVLHHTTNQGKGQALRTGFEYLLSLGEKTTIVTADADGQHALVDIDRIAHASMNLPDHLILGSRQFTNDIPLRSRFGNRLTRLLFHLQTGVRVSDTQTGLRAFHSSLLPQMLSISGNRYEYEMNMLTEMSQLYPITEIPIETIYIDDNSSSHFRPIRDSLLIYRNLFAFALASFGGFLVDYVIYILALALLPFLSTGIRLVVANTLARLISTTCNFSFNKYLVFKNTDSVKKTGIGYFTLAFFLFLADTALLYLFHQLLGINLYIVKIVVGLFLFFLSWVIQHHLIFRERKAVTHELF